MEPLERLRAWTYRRQFLDRGAASLSDALHRTIGVYSAHPGGPLSLWARTTSFSPAAFRAIEQQREVVRVPAWRGSIFLMSVADAQLAGAVREAPRLTPSWFRASGIEEDALPDLHRHVVAAAASPMTPAELRAATGLDNQAVTVVARYAARLGDILRVGSASLRANALKYVSAAAWAPQLLEPIDRTQALLAIARRYFFAYGPARVEDFRWWLGATKAEAAGIVAQLDMTDIGNGNLLPASDRTDFEQTPPLHGDEIAILPKWDPYTMGFAPDGRQRLIAPEMQARGYTPVGDGLGLVLLGGQAVAAWHHKFSGTKMQVELDIFDSRAHAIMERLRETFHEIAAHLDGKSCAVHLAAEPLAPRLSPFRNRKPEDD